MVRMIRFSLGVKPGLLTPESRVTHGRRAKWFILQAVSMLVMVAASAPSYGQQLPPLIMQGLGFATVPLDGAWQFHPGDDSAWASPKLDDSTWEPIQVGRAWEGQGHPGYTGFAWYRRHLMCAWRTYQLESRPAIAIRGGCLRGLLERRTGGEPGQGSPHPVWYLQAPPTRFVLGPPQSGVLAIRVWKAPHLFISGPDEGGLVSIRRPAAPRQSRVW